MFKKTDKNKLIDGVHGKAKNVLVVDDEYLDQADYLNHIEVRRV